MMVCSVSPAAFVRNARVLSRFAFSVFALLLVAALPGRAGAQTTTTWCSSGSTAASGNDCTSSGISISGSCTATLGSAGSSCGTSSGYGHAAISVPTSGTLSNVVVTLNGVTSSGCAEAGCGPISDSIAYASFYLVGPGGQEFELLGCTGDGYDGDDQGDSDSGLRGYSITIENTGNAAPNNNPWQSSTTVKPSSYWKDGNGVCDFGALPSNANGLSLPQSDGSATLNGTFTPAAMDGTWTLYIDNDDPYNSGAGQDPISISGWGLTLTYTAATQVHTTTSLSASSTSAGTGGDIGTAGSITFTATVTATDGSTPTGTVAFTAGGTTISGCGGVALSNKTAQCTTSLSQGLYGIEATYSGTTSYYGSDGTLNLVMEPSTASEQTNNTFCNTGSISIPAGSAGTIYPSIIKVNSYSAGTTVNSVEVELMGVEGYAFAQHLLVSPYDTANSEYHNLDFFDGAWTDAISGSISPNFYDSAGQYPNTNGSPNSGNYDASDEESASYGDTFPVSSAAGIDTSVPPVPAANPNSDPKSNSPGTINYGYNPNYPGQEGPQTNTFESLFNNAPANGDWALYVYTGDDYPETISGGWCIQLTLNTGTSTSTTLSSSQNPATASSLTATNSVNITATVSPTPSGGTVTFLDNAQTPSGASGGNNQNVAVNTSTGQATFPSGKASYSIQTASGQYTTIYEGDHNFTGSFSGSSTDDPSDSATFWQRFDNATSTPTYSGSNTYGYCNAGPVVESPNGIGAFFPNPSNVFVTNLPGTVNTASVTLNGFHADAGITATMQSLLEGPTGADLDFFSNTGTSGTSFSSGNLTLSDSGSGEVPQGSFGAGTYLPTAWGSAADSFTSSSSGFYNKPSSISYAAPHGSSTFTSTFGGTNGNGTWSLFFNLSSLNNYSGVASGWCVNLKENPVSISTTLDHSGSGGAGSNFSQNESDAQITVSVENDGTGEAGDPTGSSNPLTVVDTLPNGLTYDSTANGSTKNGSGWSCPSSSSSQTITCTNETAGVAADSTFPLLTIYADVASNASSPLTNTVNVSGATTSGSTNVTDSITVDGPPSTVTTSSGSPQSTTVATAFTSDLVVTVTDSNNNPLSGQSVTFIAPGSGASGKFSNSSATITGITDGSGHASEVLTANTVAGSYTVSASVAGVTNPAYFNLTNTAGAAASVSASGGSGQSTFDTTAFTNPLVATVGDQYGNPVAGATVTFTAPSTGASGVFSNSTTTITGTTNASGQISEAFTANNLLGGYTVSASTAGATSANFSLTNTIGPFVQLVVSAPSPAYVGIPTGFSVTAEDAGGNVESNINDTLSFSSTDAAATLPPNSPLVNGQGTFGITMKSTGSQTITATDSTASVIGTSANFTVTQVPSLIVTTNQDDAGNANNCTPQDSAVGTDASCSLRDALLQAASLGAANITFDATKISGANSTISLTNGVLTIPSYTTLTGAYTGSGSTLSDVVTISGNNQSGVFQVPSTGAIVSITGLTISNGLLSDPTNGGTEEGAGLYNNAQNGSLTIAHSIFSNNAVSSLATSGTASGGAIFNKGPLTLNDCVFNQNSATGGGNVYGGAIYDANQMTATGILVTNNTATNSTSTGIAGAGGILAGMDTITNSTFSGNKVVGPTDGSGSATGGALFFSGPSTLSYSTISGNSATGGGAGDGGGLFLVQTLAITNSTISGNTADNSGGGIQNQSSLTLNNSVIAGNSAPNGGGGIASNGSINSSSAYNVLGSNSGGDCFGSGCPTNGSNNNQVGVSNVNLAALSSYGGPTPTQLPLPGSAAICSGSASLIPSGVTTDQRGLPNTNTTYPGYTSGPACVDAGAVQTNYALSFSTQPGTTEYSRLAFPAAVTLSESGTPFSAAPETIALALQGGSVASFTGNSATTAAGVATYSLTLLNPTAVTGLQLSATLSGGLAAPATSNQFDLDQAPQATLTSPTPNTTLAGSSVTFTWSTVAGATAYGFRLGTTVGGNDLWGTGPITANSSTPTFMPTNGETIYARLTTYYGAVQVYTDYTFTTATRAALTSPTPNTTLAGPSVTFAWTTVPNATAYGFRLGTTLGGNDLYGTGPITTNSTTPIDLPTNGETIYARLRTFYGAEQVYTDYVFTAATRAALSSPAPSSVLAGPAVTFTWTTAANATAYGLRLGTTVGGNDLYGSGPMAATSTTPVNLPTDGETIYARLTTYYGAYQVDTDYTFTAATQAALTSPTPSSVLAGAKVTFTWNTAAEATAYGFRLGTTVGGNDLWGTGPITATSTTPTNLPINGETIYARLTTYYGATQVYTDYVYTAAP